MSRIQVESVPCFVQPDIQGELLPDVPRGLPFRGAFLDGLVEQCPVVSVLEQDNDNELGHSLVDTSEKIGVGLRQISFGHGRSYELFVGDEAASEHALAVWQDEFGNMFSSLSTKGNNFADPHVFQSLTAPSGYIPYGLMETDALLRVVRASKLLRSEGVDTEMIVRVLEPQLYRYLKLPEEQVVPLAPAYEYVPLPEFKRRLLTDHWKQISDKPNALTEFQKVTEAIQKMSFFIVVRAMGTATRMDEFMAVDKEPFMNQVDKAFHLINITRQQLAPELTENLDKNNPDHVIWYFLEFLPKRIGHNMALMHKAGLVHTFPSTGNTTTLGGLVDLDAVRGDPLNLGDQPLTPADFIDDLTYFTEDDEDKANYKGAILGLMANHVGLDAEALKDVTFVDELSYKFNHALVHEYLETRFGLGNPNGMSPEDAKACGEMMLDISTKTGLLLNRYLMPYLEPALASTEFPVLMSEEEIAAEAEAMTAWCELALSLTTAQAVAELLPQLSLKSLADEEVRSAMGGKAYSLFIDVLEHHIHTDSISSSISSPEFLDKLAAWVESNYITGSRLSPAAIVELIKYTAVEKTHNAIVGAILDRQVDAMTGKVFNSYDLSHESILTEDENQPEPNKQVINNKLVLLREQLGLDALLDSIQPQDLYKPIVYFSTPKSSEGPGAPYVYHWDKTGSVLVEIITDGTLENLTALTDPDSTKDSAASIKRVPMADIKDYIIFVTKDSATNSKALNVILKNPKAKNAVAKALKAKGFAVTFMSKVIQGLNTEFTSSMAEDVMSTFGVWLTKEE